MFRPSIEARVGVTAIDSFRQSQSVAFRLLSQFGHENAPRNRNNGTETPRKFPETDGRVHPVADTLTRASVLSHARRRTNASSSSPRDCFGTPLKRTRVRTSRRTQCPDAGLP
jgi:hypothetical protein|tara:strand:- start:3355 stop:3693 length:339 start_codon:yes stop_codon:yes gene_type:complete